MAFLLAAVSPGCEKSSDISSSKAVTSGDVPAWVLNLDSSGQRRLLIQRAEQGDGAAARQLATYFAMNGIEEDDSQEEVWLSKAVELGDDIAVLNYGVLLYHKGGEENCRAAVEMIERYKRENPGDLKRASGWLEQIKRDVAGLCSK